MLERGAEVISSVARQGSRNGRCWNSSHWQICTVVGWVGILLTLGSLLCIGTEMHGLGCIGYPSFFLQQWYDLKWQKDSLLISRDWCVLLKYILVLKKKTWNSCSWKTASQMWEEVPLAVLFFTLNKCTMDHVVHSGHMRSLRPFADWAKTALSKGWFKSCAQCPYDVYGVKESYAHRSDLIPVFRGFQSDILALSDFY